MSPAHRVLPALALVLLAPAVAAAWPHDPALNLPIAVGDDFQGTSQAISDGAGGVIVAYAIFDAATGYDIYAVRLDGSGQAVWSQPARLCAYTADQIQPVLCTDGAGGAIVAWTDFGNGPPDIYAQHVKSDGQTTWALDGVPVTLAGSDQTAPAIASDAQGGAFVFWHDNRNSGTTGIDVYMQRLLGTGARAWTPTTGLVVCDATGHQIDVQTVPDLGGTCFVAWRDGRTAAQNVYFQRVFPNGAVGLAANGAGATGFGAGTVNGFRLAMQRPGTPLFAIGVPAGGEHDLALYARDVVNNTVYTTTVCDLAGDQLAPSLVVDASGVAYVAWLDDRATPRHLFAQKVSPGGTAMWTANGVQLEFQPNPAGSAAIATDGAGGLMAAFSSGPSGGSSDLYAQRVGSSGARLFASVGVPLSLAYGYQTPKALVASTASEWITVFDDGRDACFCNYGEVYAQNVDLWGALGDPEPLAVDVRDVANDQGGLARVSWNASWMDDVAAPAIVDYRLWRSVPVTMAALTSDADEAARGGALLAGPLAAEGYAWEYVATQVAAQLAQYSLVATTTGDSTAGGNPPTAFMVEARATSGGGHWFSAPDSGYSVDNLAPPVPVPFTGQYQGAVTRLHWNASGAPDLEGYRVYRGSTPGFQPSPATLLATTADTGYVDVAGGPFYYRLTAVDVHGNESPAAFLQPDGVLAVPGADAIRATVLAPPYPTPTRHGATIRFALATDAPVELTLHDAAGRLVRTLARVPFAAGPHALAWDGRDDDGRPVAPGVYLLRLAAAGVRGSRRIVVLE